VAGREQLARIELWGATIGGAYWDAERQLAFFQYDPAFLRSNIELAPFVMPLADRVYSFPELAYESFRGLPGMLADSLPDRFGHKVIDAWLVQEGIAPEHFTPLDRLCYIGTRGMGALEFRPVRYRAMKSAPLDIGRLVTLANEILNERALFAARLEGDGPARARAMSDILQVSASAGGARAKALIAWNPHTNEVRSGQVAAPEGFGYWLLKFDGISNNRDKELLADPQGYGQIEYAYYLMARSAGIEMMECRLLRENGRHHFMTRRFDRTDEGGKLHLQSLCALRHFDFNLAGAYGYEQAFDTIERLGLGHSALEEQFRRMVFNVAARNQDDHTKNIAFLMDRAGRWRLAPAFDVNFAFNPEGQWTSQHQMSVNGKRREIGLDDLLAVADRFRIRLHPAKQIVAAVDQAIAAWPRFARQAGVEQQRATGIGGQHLRFAVERV
jgi:serine/threonine-protein kinase HipA